MSVLISILSLFAGFAILILGGEALVRAAISLAVRLRISPATIGLTIIAAGTSAPELITSLLAASQAQPEIALGNVIGSNVFNILAIIGFSAIVIPNFIGRQTYVLDWPFLVVSSLIMVLVGIDGLYTRVDGAILLSLLTAFVIFLVWLNQSGSQLVAADSEEDIQKLSNPVYDFLYLTVGVGCLVLGARLALFGGVELGRLGGLTERTIGITIISVGTGLPELATSAVAAFRGRSDIAVSNVIGSNIFNTLLIVGFTSLVLPIEVSDAMKDLDLWLMLLVTLGLGLTMIPKSKTIGRLSGSILLASYVCYVGFLLL